MTKLGAEPGRPAHRRVGSFELLVELFKTHFGSVWAGRVLDGEHAGGAMAVRSIALRFPVTKKTGEAIAAAARRSIGETHDHVVPILEVAEVDEELAIASALVEGAPLSELLRMLPARKAPLEPAVAVRIVRDVLIGLARLHSSPHYRPGALTADSVLVGVDGLAWLIEAGIAGAVAEVGAWARHRERVSYCAPEVLEAGGSGPAADLFTVGVLSWELLAGKKLFGGLGYKAIVEAIVGAPAPRLEAVPAPIAEAVAQALERDPQRRPASAAAFAEALTAGCAPASRAEVGALVEELTGGLQRSRRAREVTRELVAVAPARPADEEPFAVARDQAATVRPPRPGAAAPPAPPAPPPLRAGDLDSDLPPDSKPPPIVPNENVRAAANPRQVGRCELFAEIAHGGMATIHLGRWVGAGGFAKTVAVKALHPQFARDPEFVKMFLDEARVVARIRHPNVMPTIDLVEEAGELFIVMDYIHGATLAHLMRAARRAGERMPTDIVLRIVAGMLQGLHAAHDAKNAQGEPMCVIHRDVSPENVLIGVDGYARLIDFGIATAMGRFSATGEGQVKGKIGYLTPEQVLGDPLDRRTDVFSASVVLWQALTGRKLFRSRTIAEGTQRILTQEIPPPSSVVAGLPEGIDAIVLKGLERNRARRWETAEAMAEAIERLGGLASHRQVGEWVKRTARARLEQSASVLKLVETAPVEGGEIDLPLRVRPAAPSALPVEIRSRAGWGGADDTGAQVSQVSLTDLNSQADAQLAAPATRRWLGGAALVVALAVAGFVTLGLSGSEKAPPRDVEPAAPEPVASAEPRPAETSAKPPVSAPAPPPSAPASAAPTATASAPAASASTKPPPPATPWPKPRSWRDHLPSDI